MKLSEDGLKFHKRWEGFESEPYLDIAGVPTIGYGSTFYPEGTKVAMSDQPISEERATEIMQSVLLKFENGVTALVKKRLNQHQFDALVSFAYNLGLGNLKRSTLLKRINANPKDPMIPNEFTKWVRAGGKPVLGLARRRLQEAYLYTFGWDGLAF